MELYCSLEFSNFPFDYHSCNFEVGGHSHSNTWLVLKAPTVILNDLYEINLHDPPKRIEQVKLPFDIDIEVLDPFSKWLDSFNKSYSGMSIRFQRNTIGVLKGGFYFPTASFSLLSMLSFLVKPENVN